MKLQRCPLRSDFEALRCHFATFCLPCSCAFNFEIRGAPDERRFDGFLVPVSGRSSQREFTAWLSFARFVILDYHARDREELGPRITAIAWRVLRLPFQLDHLNTNLFHQAIRSVFVKKKMASRYPKVRPEILKIRLVLSGFHAFRPSDGENVLHIRIAVQESST